MKRLSNYTGKEYSEFVNGAMLIVIVIISFVVDQIIDYPYFIYYGLVGHAIGKMTSPQWRRERQ